MKEFVTKNTNITTATTINNNSSAITNTTSAINTNDSNNKKKIQLPPPLQPLSSTVIAKKLSTTNMVSEQQQQHHHHHHHNIQPINGVVSSSTNKVKNFLYFVVETKIFIISSDNRLINKRIPLNIWKLKIIYQQLQRQQQLRRPLKNTK